MLTEGGGSMGLGHVVRCLAIRAELERLGHGTVMVIVGGEGLGDFMGAWSFSTQDWLTSLDGVPVEEADVVVVDSYKADSSQLERLRRLSHLLVCLDDENRLAYPADIVLNGGLFAPMLDYPKVLECEYLVGSSFALLRPEFINMPVRRIGQHSVGEVLISMGGQDVHGLLPRTLDALSEAAPELHRRVVVAPSLPNRDEVCAREDQNTTILHAPTALQLREEMLTTDAAVCAGGQTLHEMARAGLPPVVIGVVENQRPNIEAWAGAGFIHFAGWWHEEELMERVIAGIRSLDDPVARAKKSAIGVELIDGLGARRAAERIVARAARAA